MDHFGRFFVLVMALLVTGCQSPEPTNILGQAGQGKLLCVNPDAATKTCSALSTFSQSWTGTVTETTEMLLPRRENITIQISSLAEVNGSQMCGRLGEGDIRSSIIRVKGSELPPAEHAAATGELVAIMGPLFGRLSCEELRMEYGHLKKFANIEGISMAPPVKMVAWVKSDEGYKVAPR